LEREEIEAIWERIKALEKNNLKLARYAARSLLTSTYNLMLTGVMLASPREYDSFIKYMKPKCDLAENAISEATEISTAFKIQVDFQNDCIAYLNSRK